MAHKYTKEQNGAIVYIITPYSGSDESYKLVDSPGYYYYNFSKSMWIPFRGDTEP
ncbi:hypothetical protein [Apibacter muscae]|uniref:hypothetical protein n=1 Tax=Apibacter muscae TaxID=2509004 RepID=UPI001623C7C7|nr:hypothetical protein [Apibacter muscae]